VAAALFGKRRRRGRSAEEVRTFEAFRVTVARVEQAKRALASAAPTGRASGAPLAEALAGFEIGLREARRSMDTWRTADLEDVWSACRAALTDSADRCERLRLDTPPDGYEQLYGQLGDLMDPLDEAFTAALERMPS
jgi:hypothetical protein